jgi:hypothetical protein
VRIVRHRRQRRLKVSGEFGAHVPGEEVRHRLLFLLVRH